MSDLEQYANDGLSRVKEAADGVADDLASKAGAINKSVQKNAQGIGNAVSEQYGELSDAAHDSVSSGNERLMNWEKVLEEHIQKRPLATVLIATAVGVGLALLFSRRSRN